MKALMYEKGASKNGYQTQRKYEGKAKENKKNLSTNI